MTSTSVYSLACLSEVKMKRVEKKRGERKDFRVSPVAKPVLVQSPRKEQQIDAGS